MTPYDIQAAVYDKLTGGISTPVYDDVPQDSAFPYVVIGDDTSIPFDDDCGSGFESTLTLHVWSTHKGRQEVKRIMASIYVTMHRQSLTLPDGYLIMMDFDYQDSFLDPDGVTRHGVIRFRLLTRSN